MSTEPIDEILLSQKANHVSSPLEVRTRYRAVKAQDSTISPKHQKLYLQSVIGIFFRISQRKSLPRTITPRMIAKQMTVLK